MGAWRDTIPADGSRRGVSRYLLAGGVLACLLAGTLVLLLVDKGSSGHPATGARHPRSQVAQSSGRALEGSSDPSASHAGGLSADAGRQGHAVEVRDPEEANSFPVPATLKHSAAQAPSAAGNTVAPGAASTEEVRKELAQMHAVESDARKQTLTPVKGGESIGGNGTIPIPTNMPEVIQRVIAGANAIADFPYRFGGGHGSFIDDAYDCSGSVSYALAAGGLLSSPETSGTLESWGKPGPGRYITVYANAGHTYMYVDGLLYDTAGRSGVFASRWQVAPTDNSGYVARHYPGL